jgi:hypothetical protein
MICVAMNRKIKQMVSEGGTRMRDVDKMQNEVGKQVHTSWTSFLDVEFKIHSPARDPITIGCQHVGKHTLNFVDIPQEYLLVLLPTYPPPRTVPTCGTEDLDVC